MLMYYSYTPLFRLFLPRAGCLAYVFKLFVRYHAQPAYPAGFFMP